MKLDYKKTFSAVTLLILLSLSILAATITTPTAHSPPLTIPTYAFIDVSPNPVGVNQQVYIYLFLDRFPPTAAGAGGDRWHGYVVNIVKPDGTNETLGPFDSDPVGTQIVTYTPSTVGSYMFQWSWPGQVLQNGTNPAPAGIPYVGDFFQGSMSRPFTLTVQQQQIQYPPDNPVPEPNTYWTRPINQQNRLWYQIAGNWLMAGYNASSRFAPYTLAPNTPHVVWTKNYEIGGIVGGEAGYGQGYYEGLSYETRMLPPVILNGILYYNAWPQVGSGGQVNNGFYAVDLRSGQTMWFNNGTGNGKTVNTVLQGFGNNVNTNWPGYPTLVLGQPYDFESPNQYGAIPYLWSIGGTGATARYDMYDATTGKWILSFNNALTGTNVLGPKNEFLVYILNWAGGWLAMWNSSLAIPRPANQGTDFWQWRTQTGNTINWLNGVQWNMTIDKTKFPSTAGILPAPNLAISKIGGNDIVASMLLPKDNGLDFVHAGFDLATGAFKWTQTHFVPSDKSAIQVIGDNVYVMWVPEELSFYGFNADTGAQLWGPSKVPGSDWAYYGLRPQYGYGKFFGAGYDGTMHAWDIKTGVNLWNTYEGANPETPYGQIPFYVDLTIADNKVFVANSEHSPNQPLFRGEKIWAFDVNTGAVVWNFSGWWTTYAIADGYLIGYNGYNQQIYCLGKGQTETTVTAPQTAVAGGAGILISGTVMDKSPGALGYNGQNQAPGSTAYNSGSSQATETKGTPAISDNDMTAWMEYLYNQQPCPTQVTGVPVKLVAYDSSGNSISIGTATSDAYGNYGFKWTAPANAGTYKIVATFEGSNSYFTSASSTSLAIDPAPTTTPTPEQNKTPATDMYIAIATIIIIIAIAIAAIFIRRK